MRISDWSSDVCSSDLPITCFTAGMTASEGNDFLVKMAMEIALLAKELDFTAYLFDHLNAPKTGEPHERGGEVLSIQFTDSRAMMRACHMMNGRSEERRVGKEGASTWKSRWVSNQ